MKLTQLQIKNFRSIKNEVVKFDDFTSFVGANGSGKSTVLTALNVFFGESHYSPANVLELEADDFHKRDTSAPIEITVTFEDLNSTEKEELSNYHRHGKLMVTAKAVFDANTLKAPVIQYGKRLAIQDLAPFFAALDGGKKAPELKQIFAQIRSKHPNVSNASSIGDMTESLRAYEAANPDKCIEIDSSDQFYGIQKTGKLNKFIQWVYIPAVKDASEEERESKSSALGKLLARTVRSKVNFDEKLQTIVKKTKEDYQAILDEQQSALDEVSKNLKSRLSDWAHPEVNLRVEWFADSQKAVQITAPFAQLKVGEGEFESQMHRLGHGLQRSFLISILQEMATLSPSQDQPKLILACEEPELYQHPPQIRHLADTLRKLSDENTQIVVTTHNPQFVNGHVFESVRLCKQKGNVSKITSIDYSRLKTELSKYDSSVKSASGVRAKLFQTLQPQLSEMFFAKRIIFVEGISDVAYLLSMLTVMDKLHLYRKAGAHIIPVNGKNHLIQPLLISNIMQIDSLVMCDSDSNAKEENGDKAKHKKDNDAIIDIVGLKSKYNAFNDSHIFNNKLIFWKNDIEDAFGEDCGTELASINAEVEKSLGHPGSLDKNVLAIADKVTLAKDKGLPMVNMNNMLEAVLAFCSQ